MISNNPKLTKEFTENLLNIKSAKKKRLKTKHNKKKTSKFCSYSQHETLVGSYKCTFIIRVYNAHTEIIRHWMFLSVTLNTGITVQCHWKYITRTAQTKMQWSLNGVPLYSIGLWNGTWYCMCKAVCTRGEVCFWYFGYRRCVHRHSSLLIWVSLNMPQAKITWWVWLIHMGYFNRLFPITIFTSNRFFNKTNSQKNT